jgi:hypothetical protein
MNKLVMSLALAFIGTMAVATVSSQPAVSAFPHAAGYPDQTTQSSDTWVGIQPDQKFVALLAP